jgi:hypothetical protein
VVTSLTIIVWWVCSFGQGIPVNNWWGAQRAIGLSWQVDFTRADSKPTNLINYRHSNYKGKGALFFFCQFL